MATISPPLDRSITSSSSTSANIDGATDYDTWVRWADMSASTSTTAEVWTYWTTNSDGTVGIHAVHLNSAPAQPAPMPTPEELERLRIEAEAERARALAQKAEAEKKAEELLISILDPRQAEEYRTRGQISILQGQLAKWILEKKQSYNVLECDDAGKPIRKHCVQTPDGTPLADQLATQYLYLTTRPALLLEVANHRPIIGSEH